MTTDHNHRSDTSSNHPFTANEPTRSIDMTYDHSATTIHRADLDREIESIRTERLLAAAEPHHEGIVERARRGTGRILIAAGIALAGRDAATFRTHRA